MYNRMTYIIQFAILGDNEVSLDENEDEQEHLQKTKEFERASKRTYLRTMSWISVDV